MEIFNFFSRSKRIEGEPEKDYPRSSILPASSFVENCCFTAFYDMKKYSSGKLNCLIGLFLAQNWLFQENNHKCGGL